MSQDHGWRAPDGVEEGDDITECWRQHLEMHRDKLGAEGKTVKQYEDSYCVGDVGRKMDDSQARSNLSREWIFSEATVDRLFQTCNRTPVIFYLV